MDNTNQECVVIEMKQITVVQIAKRYQFVSSLFWVIWFVWFLWDKYSTIRFLKIWHYGFGLTLLFLLIPLPVLYLTYVWIKRRKTRKGEWLAIAVSVVCMIVLLNFAAVFAAVQPMISETSRHANYMISDRQQSIPKKVKEIFPQQPGENDMYRYYHYSDLSSVNDLCIALQSHYEKEQFDLEKKRLEETDLLQKAETTWDGYQTRAWAGYDVLAAQITHYRTGYVWVLLQEETGTIVYYYRAFSEKEDTFLQSFLG